MHHIEIYVSDLAKSKQFYDYLLVSELGFKVFQSWEKGISYQKDGIYLVFLQVREDHKEARYKRTQVGLNHLAFKISSSTALDVLREKLQQNDDVPLLYDEGYPFAGGKNHYALYLEDPDRIKLEIVASKVY